MYTTDEDKYVLIRFPAIVHLQKAPITTISEKCECYMYVYRYLEQPLGHLLQFLWTRTTRSLFNFNFPTYNSDIKYYNIRIMLK